MSQLLSHGPYGSRDESQLLREAVGLTQQHLNGCEDYARIWPNFVQANCLEELPYLHVGLFKHITFRTIGVRHQRTLLSSATSSGMSSQIVLDDYSSKLQAASSQSILTDFLGSERRSLIVVDDAAALRIRGQIKARLAAALSLLPLATSTTFLLTGEDPQWSAVEEALLRERSALVYGFTWALWRYWATARMPKSTLALLKAKHIDFVHSGGWKRLESDAVSRDQFDAALLLRAGSNSQVLDFYGLVEQNGIIFPACAFGARHVPRWAAVIVRDPWTLRPVPVGQLGLLQFINVLAHGAPYHSVLTEDLGLLMAGDCACGRVGPRFTLSGRVPRAELRGCANV